MTSSLVRSSTTFSYRKNYSDHLNGKFWDENWIDKIAVIIVRWIWKDRGLSEHSDLSTPNHHFMHVIEHMLLLSVSDSSNQNSATMRGDYWKNLISTYLTYRLTKDTSFIHFENLTRREFILVKLRRGAMIYIFFLLSL